MRKIKIYGLLTCVCLMMQSCLFNEDDIFDESSAQRAIASVNECQEILKGAANGWLLEYYTGHHIDGEYCTMCGPNFCAMRLSRDLKKSTKSNK